MSEDDENFCPEVDGQPWGDEDGHYYSIDVTIIFCNPRSPCRPSSPNVLYAPDVADPTVPQPDNTKPVTANPK